MKVVKNSFIWRRLCSCLNQPYSLVDVPAGARVEQSGGELFVSPDTFEDDIVRHDATYYGCRVSPDNITEVQA